MPTNQIFNVIFPTTTRELESIHEYRISDIAFKIEVIPAQMIFNGISGISASPVIIISGSASIYALSGLRGSSNVYSSASCVINNISSATCDSVLFRGGEESLIT
jgi:hypothetical protein